MFSTSSSWTYFGTGTYLPPPVTTAIFPARASGRKGEDGEGVDAAMVLATAPTVRRVPVLAQTLDTMAVTFAILGFQPSFK
jgi:hypothetical protein